MSNQQADVEWRESAMGVIPVSSRFDDPYYSLDNGLEETRHVFLAGNDLPARFDGPLHIAELGFGTGLNALTTWQAWQAAGARHPLTFTSFEKFPLSAEQARTALNAFPTLSDLVAPLCDVWERAMQAPVPVLPDATLQVITGDVTETLSAWSGQADAWYLDGFSPAKNPQMWTAEVMTAVAQHTAPCGTVATYTAAGHVRRALTDAGFEVTRTPGYGRKRHMTIGKMPG